MFLSWLWNLFLSRCDFEDCWLGNHAIWQEGARTTSSTQLCHDFWFDDMQICKSSHYYLHMITHVCLIDKASWYNVYVERLFCFVDKSFTLQVSLIQHFRQGVFTQFTTYDLSARPPWDLSTQWVLFKQFEFTYIHILFKYWTNTHMCSSHTEFAIAQSDSKSQ